MNVEFVSLDGLTRRPRRQFSLPWHELPDGGIRFRDCRDQSRFERWARRGIVAFVWALAVVFAAAGCLGLFAGGQGLLSLASLALAFGVGFAVCASWFHRGGRCRTIDVGMDGRVVIGGAPPAWIGALAGAPGALEVCPITVQLHRDHSWKGYAVLIRAGEHAAMLGAHDAKSGCIDMIEQWPLQVAALPLRDSDRRLIAANGLKRLIAETAWRSLDRRSRQMGS